MKKIVALLVCFVLVFSLCACGKEETKTQDNSKPTMSDNLDAKDKDNKKSDEDKENVGMANPMTEYKSLDEVNKIIGGNLCSPGVMGVSDEAFFVIDCGSYKMGEYQFKINGYEYSLRCAKVAEDISGVYIDGETAFAGASTEVKGEEIAEGIIVYAPEAPAPDDTNISTEDSGIQSNGNHEYKCARWFDGDMQYVLTVHDNDKLDHDTFIGIADEFMLRTMGDM